MNEAADEDRRQEVHSALAQLIAIEPAPPSVGSVEQYRHHLQAHGHTEQAAMDILRAYGLTMADASLDVMQLAFYEITNDPAYASDLLKQCVVRSSLTKAWDGIGEFRS